MDPFSAFYYSIKPIKNYYKLFLKKLIKLIKNNLLSSNPMGSSGTLEAGL